MSMKKSLTLILFMMLSIVACGSKGEDWEYQTDSLITSGASFEAGGVYIATQDYVVSIDALNGRELWRFNWRKPPASSGHLSSTIIYFAVSNRLYALDEETGD